jgi:hypothetical protein
MPLLVDDLTGTVHHAYGEMPNMVYIIDKQEEGGLQGDVDRPRRNRDRAAEPCSRGRDGQQGYPRAPSYSEKLSFVVGYGQEVREKVLDRDGPKARHDLQTAFGG